MKLRIIHFMALGTLLASCAQDEALPGGVVPPGHSLYVASAIIAPAGKTETEAKAATRVAGDDVPVTVTTGSLGIFRSQGTGYTEALNNKKYTYMGADKGWQPATAGDTLFLNGDDAEVCAYYPYNGDAFFGSPEQILLASGKYFGSGVANPSGAYEGTDICYAVNRTVNAARRATTFEMKHALSLLEFRISKEAGYVGDCRITSISIMNPELILGSSIDITTGTYGTTPTKGTITYNPGADADGILIESSTVTTSALLVPFTPSAEGLTIAFAVNGTPVEANIPTTDIAQLEAGHRYSVKVTMKAGAMEVTGVDMMPWEEIGVGGDGYTWYPKEETIKLTAPIQIASYKWAWSNLDYVNGAITLRDNQTWPDEFAHGGEAYLVHWPYCVMVPSLTGATIAGNTVYDYNTDPCSALNTTLGGTWTLPTRHQMELLLTTDHVNAAEGCWFGTSTVPAKDNGTYLFLPANSQFLQTGSSPNFGVGGYWMSDAGPYTLLFTYRDNANSPKIEDLSTTNLKPFNAMVRCVEKVRETITIDGVEWAMGNLVHKSDDSYVIDDYQAAIPPLMSGYYWTDVSPGYHFTWNSLTRLSMADNAAYAYDVANDPCAKVLPAGTWRTPTKEEFQKAVDKGMVKGTYTVGGTTVDGYYLGTSSQPAKGDGDKYLFLPRAGEGDQNSFYTKDTGYWSSTEVTEGGATAYRFMNGSLNIEYNKSHAAAIRCVKGSLEKIYTLTKTEEVKIGTVTYARTNLNHDYTLEAEPWISGKMNGTDDDYWTFGMKDPTLTGQTAGTSYYAGTDNWDVLTGINEDPCKSVPGGNWRLPTSKELSQLSKYFLPAGEKVLVNGEVLTVTTNGKVTTDTQSTAGSVFYDAATKNTLFIPYTGNSNGISNLGNAAVLHSSEVQTQTTCKTLSLSGKTFELSVSGYDYRYGGNAIRCVKK